MSKKKCCQKWKKEGRYCKKCPLRAVHVKSEAKVKLNKKKKEAKKK